MLSFNKILLAFFILFFVSCRDKCKDYELTEEEKNFIPYNEGDKVVFKNDATGNYDTLISGKKLYDVGQYVSGCSVAGKVSVYCSFNHLHEIIVGVEHKENPYILYSGRSISFELIGSFQTITVNNATYNDIFSVQIDSTIIDTSYIESIAWKIDYSKSKGFVRFHMKNGFTWSKI